MDASEACHPKQHTSEDGGRVPKFGVAQVHSRSLKTLGHLNPSHVNTEPLPGPGGKESLSISVDCGSSGEKGADEISHALPKNQSNLSLTGSESEAGKKDRSLRSSNLDAEMFQSEVDKRDPRYVRHPSLDLNDITMWVEWRQHSLQGAWIADDLRENWMKLWDWSREETDPKTVQNANATTEGHGTPSTVLTRRASAEGNPKRTDRHRGDFQVTKKSSSSISYVMPCWKKNQRAFSMAMSELIPQTNDMVIEDVFTQKQSIDPSMIAADVEVKADGQSHQTELHEICRKGTLEQLVQRLKVPLVSERRTSADGLSYDVNFLPEEEVTTCNECGQLPLHLAAMNRSTVQEIDGLKSEMQQMNQHSPGLVAVLVTGRNPQTGERLFAPRRDGVNQSMDCVHQDSMGMTPLHLAALSDSVAAYEVACGLLEANPLAARIEDMDGFLPLDLACRNSARGSASIVKLLLRIYPQAAIVHDLESTSSDWSVIADKLDPFVDIKNESQSNLLDMELSNFVDGVLFDASEEKTHGFLKKDFTYLLPQRVCAQQLVLELSSFYRTGNISEPGLMYPVERKILLQKLANDTRKRRNKFVKPIEGIKVIHAKEAGGLNNAIQKTKAERDKRNQVRKMTFKGTWKGISEIVFPSSEEASSTEPRGMSSSSSSCQQSHSPTLVRQSSSGLSSTSPANAPLLSKTMQELNTRRGLVRSNSKWGIEATEQMAKSPKVVNSFVSIASMAFGSPGAKSPSLNADGEDGKTHSPSLKKAVNAHTQSFRNSRTRSRRKVDTSNLDLSKRTAEGWLKDLGLEPGDEIYTSTFSEALERKDIKCLEWMTQELLKEADVTNKSYLTFEEARDIILKTTRLNSMATGIRQRWRADPEYVQETANVWTNRETDHDVDRHVFAQLVENARLDNSTTQRRAEKPVQHTWSGLPIYDEEDLERVRPRVIRTRNLIHNMQRPHQEAGFQRLPLHFCCANKLNPEAAVMMRDVLSANEHAARVKDNRGRLPLHVACMNESYMSGTMVRLLLSKYKEACMKMDDDGYLPLHLCVLHNHGDAAFEIVTMLLQAEPISARVLCANQLLKKQLSQPEYAVHLALSNTSILAHKMITCLIDAHPEALVQRGNGGETMLHCFCWIQHQCPIEAQHELESVRGITKWLRAPELQKQSHHLWDGVKQVFHLEANSEPHFPQRYSPVAKLKAVINSAKKYFPHSLDLADCHGALPIHYICQVGGPCSRELLETLLQMHPHSFNVQDCNGNSPLHLAIGSGKVDLAKVLAHFASSRHWSSKLAVPNDKKQLPSQVPGAWRVRALFKINTFFDSANTCFQSIFVPAIAGLCFYLCWMYYERQDILYSIIMLAPFVSLSLINIGLDLVETGVTRDTAKILHLIQKAVLQCCQLRAGFSTLRSMFLGQAPSRRALLTRRMEMPLMAFPLAIFNFYQVIRESGQPPLSQNSGDPGSRFSAHMFVTASCMIVLALSAAEQDSHRYWSIPHMPMLRHTELMVTFFYRLAESTVRVINFSLFSVYIGPGYCLLVCFVEILAMIMLAGKIFFVIADPACLQSLEILASEFFDLCGTFHPFHVGMEAEVVLGQCGHRDTMIKSGVKGLFQAIILITTCSSIGESWAPFQSDSLESQLVTAVFFGMFSQFVILGIHYKLIEVRRRYLKDVRSLALLESWKFPLFDKLSPEFLRDAQNVLQTQDYSPGDYIIRQGECHSTMYLLVNGMINTEMPSEELNISRWELSKKTLLNVTSKLSSNFNSKNRDKSCSPAPVMSKEKPSHIEIRRDSNRSQNLSAGFSEKSSESMRLGFHGAFLGAESLFFGTPSSKNIVARTKCTTRFLNRESMAQLLIKHPKMIGKLLANARSNGLKLSKQDVYSLIASQEKKDEEKETVQTPTPKGLSKWRLSVRNALQSDPTGSFRSSNAILNMDGTWKHLISHLSISQDETSRLTISDIIDCITWELSCVLNISGSSIFLAVDFNKKQQVALSITVNYTRDPDLRGVTSSELITFLQDLVEEQGEEIRSKHFLCKIVRVTRR